MNHTSFPQVDIEQLDWISIDENNKTYITMEQVTLNKETYDRLMDIELANNQEIDRLKDIIEEFQKDGVSVDITRDITYYSKTINYKLFTKDEKLKAIKEEMLYQITLADNSSENYKKQFKERVDKIYNRNILQRIFNTRVK